MDLIHEKATSGEQLLAEDMRVTNLSLSKKKEDSTRAKNNLIRVLSIKMPNMTRKNNVIIFSDHSL